jgi:hypothetical protein
MLQHLRSGLLSRPQVPMALQDDRTATLSVAKQGAAVTVAKDLPRCDIGPLRRQMCPRRPSLLYAVSAIPMAPSINLGARRDCANAKPRRDNGGSTRDGAPASLNQLLVLHQ